MICVQFFEKEQAASDSATKVGSNVAGSSHRYRRENGSYFVRLCVPARLKQAVGKGKIHRNTGCQDFRLAKIVTAGLAARWHRAMQALERMDISRIKAGSVELLGAGCYEQAVSRSNKSASVAQCRDELFRRDLRLTEQTSRGTPS